MLIPPIEQTIYINTPPAKVYPAITTAKGWNAWFTQATTIDLRAGGKLNLRWQDWGVLHETVENVCNIIAIEPDRTFAFTWTCGSVPTLVTFTLQPLGTGTVIKVTDADHAPTADDLRICLGCAAGWGEALALLKFYLEYGVVYGRVPQN
jgi:uncharacterized protein YndB with AHSA1/START domain